MSSAQQKPSEQGSRFIGMAPPHECPLPKLHIFRRAKNPPLWSVWRCPECGRTYRYGYSYVNDDSPGWDQFDGRVEGWQPERSTT